MVMNSEIPGLQTLSESECQRPDKVRGLGRCAALRGLFARRRAARCQLDGRFRVVEHELHYVACAVPRRFHKPKRNSNT